MNEKSLSGKKLAVFGHSKIETEIAEFAQRTGIRAKLMPPRVLPFPVLLRLMRADGILMISQERIMRRSIGMVWRSGYPFFATKKQWNVLMNKAVFKEYAGKYGLPVIPVYSVDPDDPSSAVGIPFPVVVKLADGSGSTDITICRNEAELSHACGLLKGRIDRRNILVEKYLDGPFFQFEIWMQNGKAYFAYSKDRISYPATEAGPKQPFLDIYPSSREALLKERLYGGLVSLFHELGIENGSCVFQGIWDDDVPRLMDVGFRLSGGLDFKIVREETGIDLVAAHMQYALGGSFGDDFSRLEKPFGNAYATVCVGLKNGTIARFAGVEEVLKLPYVLQCSRNYREGSEVKAFGRFAQTGLRVFFRCPDRAAIAARAAEILRLITITDTAGNDMIIESPAIEFC